jgi:hypothetical protein
VKVSSLLLLPLATLACAGPLTGGMFLTPWYYPPGGAVPPSVPKCSGPIAVTVTHQLRQGGQPRELPGDPESRAGESDSGAALREVVPGRALREMFPA